MIIKDEMQLTEAVLAETGRADDPRFREVVQALIRHLHDFAREVRLTEAEFDASIGIVARLGQLTTPSHNEVRLMAGSLGLSTLVCLMNNGTEEQPTSANLLGPFWRQGAPVMDSGDSIVRSATLGPPLFFAGTVADTGGNPVAGAEVDVWHASPDGLYENQDPDQAEWNLRGKFVTDEHGAFAFRSIKPSGYPIPTGRPDRRPAQHAQAPPVPPGAHPRDGPQARLQDDHLAAVQPRRPDARHRRAVRRHPRAHRRLRAARARRSRPRRRT